MSSRLKVAMIHQPWSVVDPPVSSPDSIALWTDEVARRLVEDCDVVCYSRASGGQPASESYAGVEYRRMKVALDRLMLKAFGKLDRLGLRSPQLPFFASSWCYREFIEQVLTDLKRNPPDVVHIQMYSQFVRIIRSALPNAKIMLHMHAEWLAQLDRRTIRRRLSDADSVIFCSDHYARQARDAWPEFADRFSTVYNGVTLSEYDSRQPAEGDPGRKLILFAGRLSPDKGVHVLVEAFNRIVQEHPTAELKIVGPWTMLPKPMCASISSEPMVRNLAAFYGKPYIDQLRERMTPAAAEKIEIAGIVPRDELVRLLHAADMLVLPSIYPEGFGIPIIEAGACAVPAVVTRRGGMPEVVEDGKTGLVVEADNADALAAALLKLLDNEPLRRSLGDAAYRRVSRLFTWEHVAEELLGLYRGLLAPAEGRDARTRVA